jgi:hypothetical protein
LSEDGLPQPIEYFLASDAAAIVEHTKRVLYLEDDDIAHISNGGKLKKEITRFRERERESETRGLRGRGIVLGSGLHSQRRPDQIRPGMPTTMRSPRPTHPYYAAAPRPNHVVNVNKITHILLFYFSIPQNFTFTVFAEMMVFPHPFALSRLWRSSWPRS